MTWFDPGAGGSGTRSSRSPRLVWGVREPGLRPSRGPLDPGSGASYPKDGTAPGTLHHPGTRPAPSAGPAPKAVPPGRAVPKRSVPKEWNGPQNAPPLGNLLTYFTPIRVLLRQANAPGLGRGAAPTRTTMEQASVTR